MQRAPIVWPANLNKPQSRAKRNVPFVHRAITRTRQTWTRASNAHLGMPNRWPNKRRAFPASKENTTMSKVRRLASFAKKTPIPRTKTEPPNAFHVRKVVLPRKEVHRAPIVWLANLKKRQTRAKKNVPLVQRAITRTHQICKYASNALVGMFNRRPGNRRVFHASKENTTMSKVRRLANFAKQTLIPWTKTEQPSAFPVRKVVLP